MAAAHTHATACYSLMQLLLVWCDATCCGAHRVAYVYVGAVGQVRDSRVEVDDVAWQFVLVQVRVDSLDECRLA